MGYGGSGKQVRDLLHVNDLVDLVEEQLRRPEALGRHDANVGGGRRCSLSLLETTDAVPGADRGTRSRSGRQPEDRAGDVRSNLPTARGWSRTPTGGRAAARRPCSPNLLSWITEHSQQLRAVVHDPTPAEARARAGK